MSSRPFNEIALRASARKVRRPYSLITGVALLAVTLICELVYLVKKNRGGHDE